MWCRLVQLKKEEWIVPIEVNDTIIPLKLDTGAHVNLILGRLQNIDCEKQDSSY